MSPEELEEKRRKLNIYHARWRASANGRSWAERYRRSAERAKAVRRYRASGKERAAVDRYRARPDIKKRRVRYMSFYRRSRRIALAKSLCQILH